MSIRRPAILAAAAQWEINPPPGRNYEPTMLNYRQYEEERVPKEERQYTGFHNYRA